MPDSWIQEQNRQKNRRKQKNLDNTKGAPFLGVISGSHEPNTEVVQVRYPGGERKLRSLHPYIGNDSWIRVGAESGVPVIMAQRVDSDEPEILSYAPRSNSSSDRIANYASGSGLYRPLTPGELEIHSKGVAQTYWSRRPLLEQRGGLIRQWLNQDDLESGSKAPVHIRQLHLHSGSSIGDEERFGVVQRPAFIQGSFKRQYVRAVRPPDPILTAKFVAAAALSGVIAVPGPWAKEYSRIIKSGALFPPVLVDVREGDVIDDTGFPVTLGLSGLPMRFKGEWFCDSPTGGVTFVGIDNLGNVGVALPIEATLGMDLKIPLGDFTVSVGKNHSVTAQVDYAMSTTAGKMTFDCATDYALKTLAGAMTVEAATDYSLTTKAGAMTFDSAMDITVKTKTNIMAEATANAELKCVQLDLKAKMANLIDGADTHMVRGEDLLTWITSTLITWATTHVHPTGVGPSGPTPAPLQPPPATFLSKFAMVK